MILITGSESFVGKELIKQCKENKISVMGIDSMNIKNAEYIYHQIDIRDPKISEVIPKNIDAIIHLAALSRDADCKDKAYECFDVNVIGTLNLIKAANKKNVKQFIFASSEWVYNDFTENEEKDENEIIDASKHTSEYALSKIVSEINLKQQFMNKFCSVTILRFGIIYGPRKNNWSAVESIFNQIKNKSEITIGSLKNGRRFIHVSDIADGIIKSIGLNGFNILNLTGDHLITMKNLISESQNICSKKITIIEKDPTVVNVRNPSNLRAKQLLNWYPKISLREGLMSLNISS
jgi:nucleoside-diphosphate-sugar epimerase